jgi:hypothetical protein
VIVDKKTRKPFPISLVCPDILIAHRSSESISVFREFLAPECLQPKTSSLHQQEVSTCLRHWRLMSLFIMCDLKGRKSFTWGSARRHFQSKKMCSQSIKRNRNPRATCPWLVFQRCEKSGPLSSRNVQVSLTQW